MIGIKRKKIIISLIAVTVIAILFTITSFFFRTVGAEDLMEGIDPGDVHVDRQINDFSTDVSDFSLRLFRECIIQNTNGKNVILSPLSVLLALSMTANGAQNETLTQMEDVFGMKTEDLNEFAYLFAHLLSMRPDYAGKLDLAYSLWLKDDALFTVNNDYLQINADYYDAGIFSVPFDKKTLERINSWIKKKTNGTIPEVLDAIDENEIMYIVSALSFDSEWSSIYKENQVLDKTFVTAKGAEKETSFLLGTEDIYVEDDDASGFLKYFKGKRYAFFAILPNEGITPDDYIMHLSGQHLSEMIINAEKCSVITSMPKFRADYSIEMTGLFKAMGMELAFDGQRADFRKIGLYSDEINLYIGRVIHKTFIAVDEKGTKAGAASVVAISDKGTATIGETSQVKEVHLTRPFIFMLIDIESNIPLFIGVINDPCE